MIYFVAVPVRSLFLSDNRKSIEAEDLPTLSLAGELSNKILFIDMYLCIFFIHFVMCLMYVQTHQRCPQGLALPGRTLPGHGVLSRVQVYLLLSC